MTEIVRVLNDREREVISGKATEVVRLRERLAVEEKTLREMMTLVTHGDDSLSVQMDTGRVVRQVDSD